MASNVPTGPAPATETVYVDAPASETVNPPVTAPGNPTQPVVETVTVPANADTESQIVEKPTRKRSIIRTILARCLGLLLGALLAALITYFVMRHWSKRVDSHEHLDDLPLDTLYNKHWTMTPDFSCMNASSADNIDGVVTRAMDRNSITDLAIIVTHKSCTYAQSYANFSSTKDTVSPVLLGNEPRSTRKLKSLNMRDVTDDDGRATETRDIYSYMLFALDNMLDDIEERLLDLFSVEIVDQVIGTNLPALATFTSLASVILGQAPIMHTVTLTIPNSYTPIVPVGVPTTVTVTIPATTDTPDVTSIISIIPIQALPILSTTTQSTNTINAETPIIPILSIPLADISSSPTVNLTPILPVQIPVSSPAPFVTPLTGEGTVPVFNIPGVPFPLPTVTIPTIIAQSPSTVTSWLQVPTETSDLSLDDVASVVSQQLLSFSNVLSNIPTMGTPDLSNILPTVIPQLHAADRPTFGKEGIQKRFEKPEDFESPAPLAPLNDASGWFKTKHLEHDDFQISMIYPKTTDGTFTQDLAKAIAKAVDADMSDSDLSEFSDSDFENDPFDGDNGIGGDWMTVVGGSVSFLNFTRRDIEGSLNVPTIWKSQPLGFSNKISDSPMVSEEANNGETTSSDIDSLLRLYNSISQLRMQTLFAQLNRFGDSGEVDDFWAENPMLNRRQLGFNENKPLNGVTWSFTHINKGLYLGMLGTTGLDTLYKPASSHFFLLQKAQLKSDYKDSENHKNSSVLDVFNLIKPGSKNTTLFISVEDWAKRQSNLQNVSVKLQTDPIDESSLAWKQMVLGWDGLQHGLPESAIKTLNDGLDMSESSPLIENRA